VTWYLLKHIDNFIFVNGRGRADTHTHTSLARQLQSFRYSRSHNHKELALTVLTHIEGVSKTFRTESITKYKLTTINTR